MGERLLATKEESYIEVLVSNSLKPSAQCAKAAKRVRVVLGKLSQAFQFLSFFLLLFPIYFLGFLCIYTSAAPQRSAHSTVSSQVATHLRTNRVCRVSFIFLG
jgi:hypothetical protein